MLYGDFFFFFCLALALNSQSHVISEACGASVVAACCAGRQLIQMKGMWTLKPIKCLGKLLASLGTSSLCISTNWCLLPASLWGVSWHIEYTHQCSCRCRYEDKCTPQSLPAAISSYVHFNPSPCFFQYSFAPVCC